VVAPASKFDRLSKPLAGIRNFNAANGIFALLVGALLYVGHAAFVPVAMAILLALILSSPVEALHRAGVPRGASAASILILTLLLFGVIASLTWEPAQQWYAAAPRTLTAIQKKIKPAAQLISHIQALAARAGVAGSVADQAKGPAPTPQAAEASASAVLAAIRDSVVAVVTFAVITLFLLAGGPPMMARMTAAFFDHIKANHALHLIEKVRSEVALFYVVTTLINIGFGIATTLAMMAWGMPTPYLWGALAAVLNFIPYAGSATTLVVVSLVAIVSFDDLSRPIGVAVTYIAIAAIEGQFVQPMLVGRRLRINPLLVFMSLWFAGMFWGVAGVILATPVLVVLKVIAEHALDGQTMLRFLGPNEDADAADLVRRRRFEPDDSGVSQP
jgi:predicted PurR-regulated permease PerM